MMQNILIESVVAMEYVGEKKKFEVMNKCHECDTKSWYVITLLGFLSEIGVMQNNDRGMLMVSNSMHSVLEPMEGIGVMRRMLEVF